MMEKLIQHLEKYQVKWLGIFSLGIVFLLSYLSYLSPGVSGGMDSYNHFLIAKYAWKYPHLALDQWGKPLYTIIASPFVQFGISGAVILNILTLIGAGVFSYKSASLMNFKHAWLVYITVLLSPIFLDNIISSLTEPLCALLVSIVIYFFTKKEYKACALLAGFLPFARSEGFIILFVVVLALAYNKEFKSILYALVASVVFNLIGWVIDGEPLWIFTSNPYISSELAGRNFCGKGGIGHYYYTRHYTFGLVTSALIFCSSVLVGVNFFRKKLKNVPLLLCAVIFWLLFVSHAVIWFLGAMGGCGYVRVMVVLIPPAAIISVYIIEQFLSRFKNNWVSLTVCTLVSLNLLYSPYRYYSYKYPLTLTPEQEIFKQVSRWYEASKYSQRITIHLYPYLSVLLDEDPYDDSVHLDLWESSLPYTQSGDILIWDGHFGQHEGGVSLETLESDTSWVKVNSVIPNPPFKTLNDQNFEVHIFEKR